MKKLVVLFLTVASILGLTACGKKADITLWTGFGASISGTLKQLLIEFKEKTGITVDHETKGGYDNLKSAAIYEMATGNTPTVIIGYPDHFAEYINGSSLLPLDSFLANESEDFLDDFIDAYMPENKSFGDGLIYGLPFNKSSEVLLYNKTFFDYFKLDVPTTWQEVESVAKKCNEIVEDIITNKQGIVAEDLGNGKVGEVIFDFSSVKSIDNFRPFAYDSTDNFFITTTRQWGGTYTQRGDSMKKGYIKFNSIEGKEAMTYFDRLADEKVFTTPSFWEASYASDAFKALKCLMTVGSSAGVTYNVPDGSLFEVGVSTLPYNKDKDIKCVIQQGTNIGIMSNSTDKQREQAWELIKFLTSSDVNTRFAVNTGYIPVRKSGQTSEYYKNNLLEYSGKDANMKLRSATAGVVLAYNQNGYTPFVDDAFIGSAKIRSYVGDMVDMYIVSDKTIDEALLVTINLLPAYVDPNDKK